MGKTESKFLFFHSAVSAQTCLLLPPSINISQAAVNVHSGVEETESGSGWQ